MSNTSNNDLIFTNVNIITLNNKSPVAKVLGVKGNKINYISTEYNKKSINRIKSNKTKIIDCNSHTMLPGFIDAHCHILSYISKLSSLNISNPTKTSIKEIKQKIINYSKNFDNGKWIKITGYHEFNLTVADILINMILMKYPLIIQ